MRSSFLVIVALLVADFVIGKMPDADVVVAARIRTCSTCRLNQLPRLKEFIDGEARTYPALDLDFVEGHDPVLIFLNKYDRPLREVRLSELDPQEIVLLLHENGIFIDTERPEIAPLVLTPSAHCVAWRQTADCNPDGRLEPNGDEECDVDIVTGRSGYCECSVGQPKVPFLCRHATFTCEEACKSVASEATVVEAVVAPPQGSDPLVSGSTTVKEEL